MQFLLTFPELFYGCFHGGREGNDCSRNASIASTATQKAELWSCALASLMVWWLTSCAATRAPSWECCWEYPSWAQHWAPVIDPASSTSYISLHAQLSDFLPLHFISHSHYLHCFPPNCQTSRDQTMKPPLFLNFILKKVTLLKTSLRMGIVNLLPSLALRKLLKASGSSQITKAIKYFRN